MAETRQWQGKTSGGKFGQHFLFVLLRHIKVTTLYPILYLIIPFCLLLSRKPNRALYNYFHQIHGYSRWRALKATARTAHTFGKVVIDKFALLAGRSDQFTVNIPDKHLFHNLLDQPSGFMLAGSHIGNFELLGHCLKQDQKPINGIIFGGENPEMQQRRIETFQENHVKLIPVTPDMSHLFAIKNALDNGEIITIHCDRIFGSPKKKVVEFLGHPAEFPIGPFRLAAQMEIPILAVFLMKEKKRDYKGYLIPLTADTTLTSVTAQTEHLLRQYVTAVEDILRQYPEQWFNLYDFWGLETKSGISKR